MKLQPIESSNIQAAGFENGMLVVEFKNGGRYQGTATQEEYDNFLKAESKGGFFARTFRSRMTKIEIEAED